jgi:hypothetical protein
MIVSTLIGVSVQIRSLKDELLLFELLGPKATAVLHCVLRPADTCPAVALNVYRCVIDISLEARV